eukprot:scaffold64686_cov32-Tisochrysis_lutea.AAC.3
MEDRLLASVLPSDRRDGLLLRWYNGRVGALGAVNETARRACRRRYPCCRAVKRTTGRPIEKSRLLHLAPQPTF